ncbi:MAG: VanZ family protein [Gammaproteobacteria bacterium]|nr:VanZ family protein [Gammaproteobacteria bacterium]
MMAGRGFWSNIDCRIYRVFALLWMGFIFYMSHQPSVGLPSMMPGQDKVFHFFVYAILAFFIAGSFPSFVKGISFKEAQVAGLFVLLYAISDEFHQSFIPGRYPSMADVLADCLGGALALWLVCSKHPKNS